MPHGKGNTSAEFQKGSTVLSDFHRYGLVRILTVNLGSIAFCYSLTTWSQANNIWRGGRSKVSLWWWQPITVGKNKFYLLLLTQESFTVEYYCTVTTHQRFLIPNHFNIFYSSLPFQLVLQEGLSWAYTKALKNLLFLHPYFNHTKYWIGNLKEAQNLYISNEH